MRKFFGFFLLFGILSSGVQTTAHAQIFTPSYLPPSGPGELGIFVSDGPGDLAVEGLWRRNIQAGRLGFRGGIADTNDLSALIGIDFSWPLLGVSAPVQIAPTLMGQGVIGDANAIGVAGGLSIGIPLGDASFSIMPYFQPSIAFVDGLVGEDDGDLELIGDIGVRLGILPGYTLTFGAGLNRPGADWGIGLSRQ